MLRITLKGVRSHKLRFLLTAVAVMLGVAMVAGTYVLTGSIQKTFDDIIDQGTRTTDVSVRGVKSGTENANGDDLRAPLPISLESKLSQVDGVALVTPDIQGTAILVGKDGTAVRNGGAPTLAFPYNDNDPTVHLVSGRRPQNAAEVAVEDTTLEKADLPVGAQTKALIGNTPRTVTIVGEVKFDAALAGATLVLLDPATARQEFAPDGLVQSFTLKADPGVGQAQLRDRVAPTLPATAEAVTGKKVADETRAQVRKLLSFIPIFLSIFAVISLIVGSFIIFNTFSILVAQRTRELALLRAVGASRGQVLRVVLGEAVVLGLVGSLLGLGAGIGLAAGLKALIRLLGLDVAGGLPVSAAAVITSFLVGTVITVLAAILPAIRASRLAPVAALRDDIAAPVGGVLRRGLIGSFAIVLGAVLLFTGVIGDDVGWPQVGIGAALLLIGTIVAAPAFTRPVIRLIGAPFVLVAGTIGKLARQNGLRNPRRTSVTAAALMIGLTLVAAVSVIASSTKASISSLVESRLTADYVLNGGGVSQFPTTVAEQVAKLPDVDSVASINAVQVTVDDKTVGATAAAPQGIADNLKLDVTGGSLSALDSGQILISQNLADARGWKLGTTLDAGIGTVKRQSLTVGGIYEDNPILGSQMLVPRDLYARVVPKASQGDFGVFVKAKPGADLAALRTELTNQVKPYLVVSVQDGSEFKDDAAGQITGLLGVIYAFLGLSVVIAVIGIVNTLALSVFERTREIGLLRAVGMTRRQLRRMITVESISTAVFGALMGMVLGLVLGIAVRYGLRDDGLEKLAIPYVTLVVVLLLAGIAGLVAAVLPAWRAVRLDILRAVASD
jgi:putative ABC transport system permease protein